MGGIDLAVAAARNYRVLRAKGHTVRKTIDCWIATFCLAINTLLLDFLSRVTEPQIQNALVALEPHRYRILR